MKKTKISKYLIFLSILTFLAIFTFIVQTGYNKLTGPVRQIESGTILKPINPDLDQDTLYQINNKEEFKNEDIFLPPTPSATISGQPNQS